MPRGRGLWDEATGSTITRAGQRVRIVFSQSRNCSMSTRSAMARS
jgi:hypothetical protein